MYKAQFKSKNAYESWSTIGSYSSESAALSAAFRRRESGALMVRVVNAAGHVIYSG